MAVNKKSELLLTKKEIDKLQHNYPCLDLSMIDDYRSEIEALLETQITKVKKHCDKVLRETVVYYDNYAKEQVEIVKRRGK